MSRIKRFAHSFLSGFVQLGASALFALVSLPLAAHYLGTDTLGKAEIGLWFNAAQMAGYIALMDLGLNASAARILIDYKDDPQRGGYGGIIQTAGWVGLAQAMLIFAMGTLVAFVAAPLLHIPAALEGQCTWLVIGLSGIIAFQFATRIFANLLTANQRFDVGNYGGALGLVANYAVLWWAFSRGKGVYSLLWGQAANAVLSVAVNWIGCWRLSLFPQSGHWGRPTWEAFRELFVFGRDAFLIALGNQFMNFSQSLILTRLLGLNAAAIWGVCTKTYNLLVQVITRIFDYSSSALAEMIVRGERERLLRRFREIAVLSVNLAVCAGTLLAVCNGPFVKVWMPGNFGWPARNDLLLGLWLVTLLVVRTHCGFVGQTKAFRFMRFIYFLEGFAFVGLTVLFHFLGGGIGSMLIASIVCSLCFTFSYGLWRTREYFHLSWGGLARWHRGTLALAATIVPAAALVWWLTRNLPALQRLEADAGLGIWIALMFLRHGFGASLRAEALRFAPGWAEPILARMCAACSEGRDKM
jgi:O-antigen/teichoic acid export membrane protein